MATTNYPTVPVARSADEPWPVDDNPIGVQADEMFARQLDTGFAAEVRNPLHDPATGLAAQARRMRWSASPTRCPCWAS